MSLYRSTWDQAANWHLGTIASARTWQSDDATFEQMYDQEDSTAIARRAWELHIELFGPLTKGDLLDMLVGKQKDYGSQNIMRFGIQGIKVRLWDKIARYNNLVGKDTSDPVNESLADTLKDMIGYVVLWWMVEDGEMEFLLECGDDIRMYELPEEDWGDPESDYVAGGWGTRPEDAGPDIVGIAHGITDEEYSPWPAIPAELPPPNPNFTLTTVGWTPGDAHDRQRAVYQMVPYTGDIR